ncbi:S-adenosyl-L-methionine-dependent methyltransferase [Glonium stellatum]|uniref:S-adenosyl-L-methionine-dependent methyltransferase n=1 Tax=Glonium stellatum TaxID=574774 RepID=A0A8E2JZU0_9PEZI|nr:S-adenosyl-L-methionine-dependent methyltransferase [Glonium stellatum]
MSYTPKAEDQQSFEQDQFIGYALEVDASDTDSALGDLDRESITTSLTPSVTQYRYSHGRRYNAFEEGTYWLPNDEAEIERLDVQHHVWRLTLNGKLYISPISDHVQNVLDIGTGTGRWVIEFADEHPSAQVLGTDLSPIQPSWTPSNCSFLIDNAENEWLFDNKFDFIHSRMLLMGIHDWPRYFKQTWDNLRPGGWMEVHEVQFPVCSADESLEQETSFVVWSQYVRDASAKVGIDTMAGSKFKRQLEDKGFINIRKEPVKWAIGPWPKGSKEKDIGKLTLENTREFMSAISMALFTKNLGWTTEEIEAFLAKARADLEDRKKHYYWQMYILCAQKPTTAVDDP